jgi:regulator of sigma E protease
MLISVIINAVIIAFVFGVLIVVHELGHFLAARRVGIKVEKFALGLGKKLLGFRKGDTEYVLNLIPIGGYVKLSGEDPSEATGAADEFQSKPVGKRFWCFFQEHSLLYIGFLLFIVFFMADLSDERYRGCSTVSSTEERDSPGGCYYLMDGKRIKFWEDVLKPIHKAPMQADICRDHEGPEKLM